jgi:hypothetical protein
MIYHMKISFSIKQPKINYKMRDEVVTAYFKVWPEVCVSGPRRVVIPVTWDRDKW